MFRLSIVVSDSEVGPAYQILKSFGIPEIAFVEDMPAREMLNIAPDQRNGADKPHTKKKRALRAKETFKGKREGGRGIRDIVAEVVAAAHQKGKFVKAKEITYALTKHGFSKGSYFFGVGEMMNEGTLKKTKSRGIYEICKKK